MKKTIFTLAALSSLALGETITHVPTGTEFTQLTETNYSRGINNPLFSDNNNALKADSEPTRVFIGGYGAEWSGIYMAANSGLLIDNKTTLEADLTVKFLYLDEEITSITSSADTEKGGANMISWARSENNPDPVIYIADGGWVDINRDYGNNISLKNMTSGTVYLNTHGSLDLTDIETPKSDVATLSTEADLVFEPYTLADGVDIVAELEDLETPRLLVTGDLSNWKGTLTLSYGVDKIVYKGGEVTESTGVLKGYGIDLSNKEGGSYVGLTSAVPEPTTATLSLLALAGLCVRRRRR